MGLLLTNTINLDEFRDARSTFDRFSAQIDASVQEFNLLRGAQYLRCERKPNRIAVLLPSKMSMELEYSELDGVLRMRRQELGQNARVITDLHLRVERTKRIALEPADYDRLAKQALHPLMASV